MHLERKQCIAYGNYNIHHERSRHKFIIGIEFIEKPYGTKKYYAQRLDNWQKSIRIISLNSFESK